MRNYYTVFDIEESRVGLAGVSITEANYDYKLMMTLTYAGTALMVCVMIAVLCIVCKDKRRAQDDYFR